MNGADVAVLAAVGLMLGLHELRATFRERRRRADQATMISMLQHNRALTLAAVDQRSRLEFRTDLIEAAIGDHAHHLEALGRVGALKIPVAR